MNELTSASASRPPGASVDERELARRVASLSLERQVALLTGADFWSLHPEPTVGLRRLVVSDGPAGVRGERPDGAPGAEVRFLAADGRVTATELRDGASFNWWRPGAGSAVEPFARVEVHAVVVAIDAGEYAIAASGIGRYALAVGGETVLDTRLELPPGTDVVVGLMVPPQAVHTLVLAAGEAVEVVLTHELDPPGADGGGIGVSFQLNLLPPHGTDDEEIARAVELAADADAVVVVVGTTEEVESEGFDRASLALPGRQDELVARVAAAHPSTVVVVNAGAPVLTPWADEVAAVLLAWFPGQEFGHALADVLLGDVEPGGRLPTTWPAVEDGLPSPHPVDGVLVYAEGLRVGYRAGRDRPAPRFPFGHGLGYTTWSWEAMSVPAAVRAGEPVSVSATVRNTGQRPGREVVQVYAARPGSAVARPERWLAGFAAVTAAPGEAVTATVVLAPRAFAHWDSATRAWAWEPGRFTLSAGPSCAAPALEGQIELAA